MRAFLSHSSADNVLAERIYRALRDQAVSVWFDRIELRPGDSLMSRIAAGIDNADVLLVLLTEDSLKSPWVRKETALALTKGMRVIPLRVAGCRIPRHLSDQVYISLDNQGTGIEAIIPAIFRDSYILDVRLYPTDLELDIPGLREGLHEYYRSDFGSLRARIENHNFNQKIAEIAEKSAGAVAHDEPFAQQIERVASRFPITVPMYWTNLAEFAARLTLEIFSHFGRTLDAHEVAIRALDKTLQYAQAFMAFSIQLAVQPHFAERFGFPEIARYLQRFGRLSLTSATDAEELCRLIFNLDKSDCVLEVELVGSFDRRAMDSRVYLPNISDVDRASLQFRTIKPTHLIDAYSWYTCCVPQIIGKALFWTAFREGKPLHELDYVVGLRRDDYDWVGLP